jgi:GNAT superfamily N-acetyltransferase
MIRRKYQDESDQARIRQFLQEVFLLNGRREHCWPLYRWDYWRWHINANLFHFDLRAAVFLWQNKKGQLIAVLNPDRPGEAFLQVHPDYRFAELEVDMMSVAETQYATTQPEDRQKLVIWTQSGDTLRQDILARRGYSRQSWPEYQRRRTSDQPVLEAPIPAGYSIRSLGGEEELPARSWVSWKAFHPGEPDEKYEGWEWYRNVQRAPLYRRDLDLVAVAPDGEIAAFCTVWFDPATCTAAFEPVGTHPAHQRRGLGKALMAEGLRRAHRLGTTLVTVASYDEAAGALYASVGFSEYDLNEPWMKAW